MALLQAGQAGTVFYQYAAPRPVNTEARLGWLLLGIAFLAAVFPVLGIGMYLIGILLCIAGFVIGCVGVSKGDRISGSLLVLAGIAAVPGGILLAPLLSGFFA